MMFSYYLRKALRDKAYVFWALAFPILLMTCFHVTFMGPEKGEVDFEPVKCSVIYVNESAFTEEFGNVLQNLSDPATVKNSNMGYNHEIVELIAANSQEEAEKMILDKKIEVLFLVDGEAETIEVKVGDSVNTTTLMVARSIVESYRRNYQIMKDAAMTAPDKIQ